MKIRTISVYTYRSPKLGDCTNNGISAKYDDLLVYCPDGPHEIDSENVPENFVMVNTIKFGGETYYHLTPAEVRPDGTIGVRGDRWYMSGGNFAASSDSRFSRLVGGMSGAVSIHDRYETPTEYRMSST